MSAPLFFGEQYGRKHKETHYTKTISKNGSFRPTVQSCAADYDRMCQLFSEWRNLQFGTCCIFCAIHCCRQWRKMGRQDADFLYCHCLSQCLTAVCFYSGTQRDHECVWCDHFETGSYCNDGNMDFAHNTNG